MLRDPGLVLVCALLSGATVACNDWQTPSDAMTAMEQARGGSGGAAPVEIFPPDPASLHVVGNQIKDANDQVIVLRGVNRSGTQYACVNGSGIFDGPSDEASIQVMAGWNVNAVRVPLNESCWLAINGVNAASSGTPYRNAITSYVNLLHKYHLTPILELHWTAEGTKKANDQQPMPDADHAPAFWADVAATFLEDTGVVFELFNEPFPDSNRDTDAAWGCWRDGCIAAPWPSSAGVPGDSYQSVGMQGLVNAVRQVGATQLILLGGVEYSNALTQWEKYKPTDPINNLAAAWHIYNFNSCNNLACWNSVLSAPAALGQQFPVVATEIGEDDCKDIFVNPLMQALEKNGNGYLAWSWNAGATCTPASQDTMNQSWSLITDYASGTAPSAYAQAIKAHLAVIAR